MLASSSSWKEVPSSREGAVLSGEGRRGGRRDPGTHIGGCGCANCGRKEGGRRDFCPIHCYRKC